MKPGCTEMVKDCRTLKFNDFDQIVEIDDAVLDGIGCCVFRCRSFKQAVAHEYEVEHVNLAVEVGFAVDGNVQRYRILNNRVFFVADFVATECDRVFAAL